MTQVTENLLLLVTSFSSVKGCPCHWEPFKMRIYTPASSGEGANFSQITSGPDGCAIICPCCRNVRSDPETTQPGGQRLGPRCDGECPTWPLAPRPSHKSISWPGWLGSYGRSQDQELNPAAPHFKVVPFRRVKVTRNIRSHLRHLNFELFLEPLEFK